MRVGDVFEYSYREVWPTVRKMVDHCGYDHLHWGTDMPFQNRFCTYKQSRQYLERHCLAGSTDAEIAQLMGGTACRLLKILPRNDKELGKL